MQQKPFICPRACKVPEVLSAMRLHPAKSPTAQPTPGRVRAPVPLHIDEYFLKIAACYLLLIWRCTGGKCTQIARRRQLLEDGAGKRRVCGGLDNANCARFARQSAALLVRCTASPLPHRFSRKKRTPQIGACMQRGCIRARSGAIWSVAASGPSKIPGGHSWGLRYIPHTGADCAGSLRRRATASRPPGRWSVRRMHMCPAHSRRAGHFYVVARAPHIKKTLTSRMRGVGRRYGCSDYLRSYLPPLVFSPGTCVQHPICADVAWRPMQRRWGAQRSGHFGRWASHARTPYIHIRHGFVRRWARCR